MKLVERVTNCSDLCTRLPIRVLKSNKAKDRKALLRIQDMTSNGGNTNTPLINNGSKKKIPNYKQQNNNGHVVEKMKIALEMLQSKRKRKWKTTGQKADQSSARISSEWKEA